MKTKISILILICAITLTFSACAEEKEVKQQKTIEDIDSLFDKYSNDEELNVYDEDNTEWASETIDNIDYENLLTLGAAYYSVEGFVFEREENGARLYTGEDMYEAVSIYSYVDTSKVYTGAETVLAFEESALQIYGNYYEKSTYVNDYGIEFVWYKYDTTNNKNMHILIEVFVYSDGIDTIVVEGGTNVALGKTSDKIYDFVDSIILK